MLNVTLMTRLSLARAETVEKCYSWFPWQTQAAGARRSTKTFLLRLVKRKWISDLTAAYQLEAQPITNTPLSLAYCLAAPCQLLSNANAQPWLAVNTCTLCSVYCFGIIIIPSTSSPSLSGASIGRFSCGERTVRYGSGSWLMAPEARQA